MQRVSKTGLKVVIKLQIILKVWTDDSVEGFI